MVEHLTCNHVVASSIPAPGTNIMKFTLEETSRIIEMAWQDRITFEAIEVNFGINESQVMRIMKQNLKPSSYRMWRKRVKQKSFKNKKLP